MLNSGLAPAMEFGEHFRQPIRGRLAVRFPQLPQSDLDAYEVESDSRVFGYARGLAEVLEFLNRH